MKTNQSLGDLKSRLKDKSVRFDCDDIIEVQKYFEFIRSNNLEIEYSGHINEAQRSSAYEDGYCFITLPTANKHIVYLKKINGDAVYYSCYVSDDSEFKIVEHYYDYTNWVTALDDIKHIAISALMNPYRNNPL